MKQDKTPYKGLHSLFCMSRVTFLPKRVPDLFQQFIRKTHFQFHYFQLYSSRNGFRIKSEIKLSGESPRRLLSGDTFTKIWFPARPACQPFASPILILAGTGKTENQIGFSIHYCIYYNLHNNSFYHIVTIQI